MFHNQLEWVTLLEARKWIIDGTPEQIMNNVEDDIEHVSGTGAKLIAAKLKAAIV